MTRATTRATAAVRHADDDVARMGAAVMGFVRDFGLLHPDQTPGGMPLTVAQAHAITQIGANPGITQRNLGATLGLARATTSELVADLVARGWLTQTPSETDRRQRCLGLTAAGRRIHDDVAAVRRRLMDDLLAELPVEEQARLVDAVELLADTAHRYRMRTAGPIDVAAS
jgi:DNA-binding MarR family transcriptional regulator